MLAPREGITEAGSHREVTAAREKGINTFALGTFSLTLPTPGSRRREMQPLCPHFPPTPIPPHRHFHPHSQ